MMNVLMCKYFMTWRAHGLHRTIIIIFLVACVLCYLHVSCWCYYQIYSLNNPSQDSLYDYNDHSSMQHCLIWARTYILCTIICIGWLMKISWVEAKRKHFNFGFFWRKGQKWGGRNSLSDMQEGQPLTLIITTKLAVANSQ